MKKGDELVFRKFKWVLTKIKHSPAGVMFGKYMVKRKYYGIYLKYTEQTYDVFPHQWNYYKQELEKNPNYHYTQR